MDRRRLFVSRRMADRFQRHDMQTLIRSLAMAPLDAETVRQVLEEHDQLLAERAELDALLARLLPAWGEIPAVMCELSRRARRLSQRRFERRRLAGRGSQRAPGPRPLHRRDRVRRAHLDRSGHRIQDRDGDETLTLRRDNRDIVLTTKLDLVITPASLWSSYTDESEREKWGRLMALVEVRAD